MRQMIANSLCAEAGFNVLNRKSDLWVLGRQKNEKDAFEVFYIADIREEESGDSALDIYSKVKEKSAALDSDIRLHLMIITDKRIPERLSEDDTVYDFLWILNTHDKCVKLIQSETNKQSNFIFIKNNGLNLMKTLITEIMLDEAKDWKLF